MSKLQNFEITKSRNYKMLKLHNFEITRFQNVETTKCRNYKMLKVTKLLELQNVKYWH